MYSIIVNCFKLYPFMSPLWYNVTNMSPWLGHNICDTLWSINFQFAFKSALDLRDQYFVNFICKNDRLLICFTYLLVFQTKHIILFIFKQKSHYLICLSQDYLQNIDHEELNHLCEINISCGIWTMTIYLHKNSHIRSFHISNLFQVLFIL